MDLEKLLNDKRLYPEPPENHKWKDYPIDYLEKDYNKIVSSVAFRRLQDKTQVFPLDKSDFVRTRLTHSLEVSTIARQLGIMIAENTTNYKREEIAEHSKEISSTLMCAGLLHDLGNPPFGHFGETVIGEWFRNNLDNLQYYPQNATESVSVKEVLSDQMISDLEHFEGNAQTLRMLLSARNGGDINVSYSVISSLVKYTKNSLNFDTKSEKVYEHKMGYYCSEEDVFNKLAEELGTKNSSGEVCRHPLAFFLEAADDIAYATADLEDAFQKGAFSLSDFIDYFESSYKQSDAEKDMTSAGFTHRYSSEYYAQELINRLKAADENLSESKRFHDWVYYTRRWLMHNANYAFSVNYPSIMKGEYNVDLFENVNHTITMQTLKRSMAEFVYDSPSILRLEISAQTILSFLLERFINAVLYFDYQGDTHKPTKSDKKYISLISENYKDNYYKEKIGHEADEAFCLYLKFRMVIDFISGMTDSYARTLYRELSGIE